MLAVAHTHGAGSEAPELWDGLVGLWPLAAGGGVDAYDLSGYGNHGTLTNMDPATDWVPSPYGWALDLKNTAVQYLTIPAPQLTGSFTFLWLANLNPTAANHGVAGRPGNWTTALFLENNGNQTFTANDGTGIRYDWGLAADVSGWHLWSWRWDNVAKSVRFGRDLEFHDVAAPGENFSWTLITALGQRMNSCFEGPVALATLASRVWLDSEIGQLCVDPHAIVTPLSLTLPSAGAPSGAISGSTSLAFSTAGALAGKGALSGSTSLTFTPAGSLRAKGALAGQSSLTFTPAGTLQAKGALAGQSSLTFTPSGLLATLGNLAGSSSLVFSPSGALAAKGALKGSSSLSFSASGALVGAAVCAPRAAQVYLSGAVARQVYTGGGIGQVYLSGAEAHQVAA